MTKRVGHRLPDSVLEAFDGHNLSRKIGSAYLLVTLDPDGLARPCMLSAGEILAVDNSHLRFALWPGTDTSRNLAAGRPILLCFVAPELVLYIRGRPRALRTMEGAKLGSFEIFVVSVESDNHVGMPVTQTIAYSVGSTDSATVTEMWERQLDALREA